MKLYKSLNPEIARAAYQNISHSPGIRAQQTIQNYYNICEENIQKLKDAGILYQDNFEIIKNIFSKYHSLYTVYLQKKSRCFSVMITGPSNFNSRRHKKSNNAEQNALDSLLAFDIYIQIKKSIKNRDKNLEKQALQLLFNVNAGFAGQKAGRALKSALADLTSSTESLKKKFAELNINPESEILYDLEFVKAVDNKSLDRVQLIFDNKPSEKIRTILKQYAFRWSPKNGAWQRKNTVTGINAILNLKLFDKLGERSYDENK